MKDILETLKNSDLTEYAPIPFWSWNNRLEKDKLLAQIRDMKSAGMGGFIIHARTGLTTEYLSEKWFSLIEACLDEAKALGMNAWIYDENGWPSGFAGGKLLEEEENLAPYLVKEERAEFDETAFAVFEKTGAGLRRLQKGEVSGDEVYHTVYVRRSPANTDILEPKVVDKFLALTHEEYYRRFSERFGKELVGFLPTNRSISAGARRLVTPSRSFGKRNTARTLRTGLSICFTTTKARILSASVTIR